jgi:hypothetical protein
MSINVAKEKAFINLAIQEGLYDNSALNCLKDLAESGVALAPFIFEKLISKLMGKKQLHNEAYRDFDDDSDAKTSSCSAYVRGQGWVNYKGAIGKAEHKIGYVRAAIYNEYTNKIDFFLIPPSNKNRCNYNYAGSIMYSYNICSRKYSNGLESYRKENLKEVCVDIA